MHIVWVSMHTEINWIFFFMVLSAEKPEASKLPSFMRGAGKNMEEVTFALPASRYFSVLVFPPSQFIQLFSRYNWWQVSRTVNQTLYLWLEKFLFALIRLLQLVALNWTCKISLCASRPTVQIWISSCLYFQMLTVVMFVKWTMGDVITVVSPHRVGAAVCVRMALNFTLTKGDALVSLLFLFVAFVCLFLPL